MPGNKEAQSTQSVPYPDKDLRLLKGIQTANIELVREALSHGANPKKSPHSTAKDIHDDVRFELRQTKDPVKQKALVEIDGLIKAAQQERLAKMAAAVKSDKPVQVLPSQNMFRGHRGPSR